MAGDRYVHHPVAQVWLESRSHDAACAAGGITTYIPPTVDNSSLILLFLGSNWLSASDLKRRC
jgi:hypothetical protein